MTTHLGDRADETTAHGVTLPLAGRLAWWGTAWLRGHVGPDDLLDAVLADDVTHVVVGGEGPGLLAGLAELRGRGAEAFGAAFPVEGDLAGLGGPVAFNDLALESGEAALALGGPDGVVAGLVPWRVGPTVEWHLAPARRRQVPDVGEADRDLRAGLLTTAGALADLEVAKWRPEVADRLMDLRHRETPVAPPGVPPRCVDLAARGLQAAAIVELALEDDGGALGLAEATARADALRPLGRAARRALIAACSPEGWPPA